MARIKHLFNDLKKVGKKKYSYIRGEEALFFTNKQIEIEIYNYNGNLDVIINKEGERKNYENSSCLSYCQKEQIRSIMNACTSLEVKCASISSILRKAFLL